MKKILIISIAAAMSLLISCGQTKENDKTGIKKSEVDQPTDTKDPATGEEPTTTPTSDPKPEVNPDPIVAPKPNAIIDPADPVKAEELDNQVREEAKKVGADENKHRVLIETKEDGTKIYREIGRYVIVHADGKEDLVPDQR